jgi:cation diffusion facilitator family transporter
MLNSDAAATAPDASLSAGDRPQFPAPVRPGGEVAAARRTRLADLQRTALTGIGLRIAVIAGESLALWWWRYAALLTDVLASALDVLSSLALVAAIRAASRPPDAEHPFGHGRYEPLAGLQLGVLIAAAGGWLLIRFLWGLLESEAAGAVSAWAWSVPAAAAVVMALAARLVQRIGVRERSSALTAEARHYWVDAATSLIAAVGLALAAGLPEIGHHVDLLSAALLAAIMITLGLQAIRENLHQLLDRAPEDERFDRVRAAALRVPGVRGVEKLRIQQAGPDAHVDIDIEVDPELSVAAAHVIAQHVRAEIQAEWPFVLEVVVHVEPYYAGDH